MDDIRISKRDKKKVLKWKNEFGLKYDFQSVKLIIIVFEKVYEKDKDKIAKLVRDKFNGLNTNKRSTNHEAKRNRK